MTLFSWFNKIIKGKSGNRHAKVLPHKTQYLQNYTMWPTAKIKPTETFKQKNAELSNGKEPAQIIKDKSTVTLQVVSDRSSPSKVAINKGVVESDLAAKKA